MKPGILFFLFISFLSVKSALGQEFEKMYSNPYYYYSPALTETNDSGFIMVGTSQVGNGSGASYATLIKTDSLGTVQWSVNYNDIGITDVLHKNGHIYFTGAAMGSQANSGILVAEINQGGTVQWSRLFQCSIDKGIKMLSANDKIVIAAVSILPGRDQDFSLVKLDSVGNVIWSRAYGTPTTEFLDDVIQTHDGGFLLTGYTSVNDSLLEGAIIVKTDSMGNMEWSKNYRNGIPQQRCYTVQQDDGSYTLAGDFYQSVGGHLSAYIMHLDSTGNIIWEKNFSRCSNLFIRKSDNGSILAGGYHVDSLANQLHCIIYKVDSTGNILWGRNYADTLFVILYDMIHLYDSSYVVTGITYPGMNGQFFLMKLNNSLTTNCTSIDLPTPEYGISFSDTSIANDTLISVTDSAITFTYIPVSVVDSMLCSLINKTDQIFPESIIISPNPFHTVLRIEGITSGYIKIYDLMGKIVYSSQLNGEVDLQRLVSGMFVLEIWNEKGVIRRRVLKE